jgi:hypothetical protein
LLPLAKKKELRHPCLTPSNDDWKIKDILEKLEWRENNV